MLGPQRLFRKLLIERLSERLALHAGELEEDSVLIETEDGYAYYYDPPPAQLSHDEHSHQELGHEEHSHEELGHEEPGHEDLSHDGLSYVQSGDEGLMEDGSSGLPLAASVPGDGFQPLDSPSGLEAPFYHSNPSFPKKIYLDFTGHVVTGTSWNNRVFFGTYNTGATITAPAFSLDGDLTTFNSAELALIQDVWARVSEDYAPFEVDVTTEEPPAALFTAGSQAMRVVISTNFDAVTGQQWYTAAGGVAFLNSWTNTSGTPCWVFANYMSGVPKYFAAAASHEVGHTLNLRHDGRTTVPREEYYNGHGSGATSWGPIMGSGYYSSLTQWSKGEYALPTNTEDDLAIINARLAYVTDDHGDTVAAATRLNVGTASTLAASGLITTRNDIDGFRFATQTGQIALNVAPFDYTTNKANLDAKITLLNSAGDTVASVDNVNAVHSTLTISVAKGFYTLLVDGSGRPSGADEGYTDYASIGQYSISGTIIPNAAPTVVNDTATVVTGGSVLIDVLANDSDANNDVLSLLSVSSPAVGAVVIESGKLRYTAGNAPGQVVLSYSVIDELGLTTTGTVIITINPPPPTLGSVILGDGTAQRSMMRQIAVTIQGTVSIASGAFTVVKRGADGGVVTTTATPLVNGADQTIVTLTFSGGLTRDNGILIDGYYQLTIDGSKITRNGQALDTNGDGQGGDSYTIGANESDNFYALYGEVDSDGILGITDFGQFRNTFGRSSGQAGFNPIFDYDFDGIIGIIDFGQFRNRFGKPRMVFS